MWQHYKGKNYNIVGIAMHSDETFLVVYEPLHDAPYKLFTRSLTEWRDMVEWEGAHIERFIKM